MCPLISSVHDGCATLHQNGSAIQSPKQDLRPQVWGGRQTLKLAGPEMVCYTRNSTCFIFQPQALPFRLFGFRVYALVFGFVFWLGIWSVQDEGLRRCLEVRPWNPPTPMPYQKRIEILRPFMVAKTRKTLKIHRKRHEQPSHPPSPQTKSLNSAKPNPA